MQARLDPRKAAPEAMKAMSNLHAYVGKCGLDHKLLELVKLRASQINSCAWCMGMHTKELRAAGEPEQRLYLLGAWQECPIYSERERAALRRAALLFDESAAGRICPHCKGSRARPDRPCHARLGAQIRTMTTRSICWDRNMILSRCRLLADSVEKLQS